MFSGYVLIIVGFVFGCTSFVLVLEDVTVVDLLILKSCAQLEHCFDLPSWKFYDSFAAV